MGKRSFDIAFKKEVIEFMLGGKTCYAAKKYFEAKNRDKYDQSMFQQWYNHRDKIKEQSSNMKRIAGGGRKTSLGSLEQVLHDEIIDLRIQKIKVTRTFVHGRAVSLAQEYGIELKATGNWISGFLKRNGFTLRRTTNFTTLTDIELVTRAVNYMMYLNFRKANLNMQKTLLMDETAVFFEDARTSTVDLLGARHVVMKSTGFASMRVTAIISVWANGKKAMPLVIHKGKDGAFISHQDRVLYTTQSKAWVNQDLIINWIDQMFPLVDFGVGKCIVWDSCRVHISHRVKEHCQKRKIEMIVIPGGLTPYLQAGDIGIFRSLKDLIFRRINEWKNSESVKFTKKGNPRAPDHCLVNSWVGESWAEIKTETLQNSILSAGFGLNYEDWHISKHDVYGKKFCEVYTASNKTDVQYKNQMVDENDCYEDLEYLFEEDE